MICDGDDIKGVVQSLVDKRLRGKSAVRVGRMDVKVAILEIQKSLLLPMIPVAKQLATALFREIILTMVFATSILEKIKGGSYVARWFDHV